MFFNAVSIRISKDFVTFIRKLCFTELYLCKNYNNYYYMIRICIIRPGLIIEMWEYLDLLDWDPRKRFPFHTVTMIDDQLRVEVYRLPACFERLKSKGIFNFCIRLLNQRSSSPILIFFFLLLLLESSKISLGPVYLVEITAGLGINLEAKLINFIDIYVLKSWKAAVDFSAWCGQFEVFF